MNHIFISHSHEDSDFSEILGNKLSQAGYVVWTDTGIRVGEDWRAEIDRAIKGAFALVVVMTPSAKASEYVTYEWAFAWGVEVKVVPIMLKRTELHPRLESLQHLDFTNRIVRPWSALIELLREAETSKPRIENVPEPENIKIENKVEQDAYDRMIETLQEEGWTWRSIERLAIAAGVSEEMALSILRRNRNVVFGKGKSGRQIARLKTN